MTGRLEVDDFKNLDPVEWVRKRPNVYLGSEIEDRREETVLIVRDGQLKFARKQVKTSVANLQTFREVMSNANDNIRRYKEGVVSCTVKFENVGKREIPIIEISNGGHAPPIKIMKDDLYLPHIIFGKLFSGSNFNESNADSNVGGVNGIGVKATNIFSEFFEVIIMDTVDHKKWFQRFEEFEPLIQDDGLPYKITDWNGSASKVSVRYRLNERLGIPHLGLYAMDVIAAAVTSISHLTFHFQDEKFNLRNLKLVDWLSFYPEIETEQADEAPMENEEEASMKEIPVEEPTTGKTRKYKKKVKLAMKAVKQAEYLGPPAPRVIVSWKDAFGNEVIVADVHKDFNFPRVQGFVNGIPCSKGIHIKTALQVFAKAFEEKMSSDKDLKAKLNKYRNAKFPSILKDNVLIIVKVEHKGRLLWGGGQNKDEFVGVQSDTGEKIKIDLNMLSADEKMNPRGKELPVWGDWKNTRLMQVIVNSWENDIVKEMKKSDGKKIKHVNVKCCEDANLAGTKDSDKCTLIFCEGDSAAAYIRKYIALKPNGKDYYGIFAFRGKPLNVMKAYIEDIIENKEFADLKKALGLQYDMDYTLPDNQKTRRYGKVMIAVDADHDGAHIRAIIMAFCRYYIRGSFETGYITSLCTPIVRVQWQGETYRFYRDGSYRKWIEEDPKRKKALAKYYKGLGTSDDDEIKDDYEANMVVCHRFDEESENLFTLAMDDGRSDDRKNWISEDLEEIEEPERGDQLVSHFLKGELIHFYHYSLLRAIARLDSGLKAVQLQLLWALKNTKDLKKVQVLAARMVDTMKYHHADTSASKALIQMTRNFTMSNNVPYFIGKGQFGTRFGGGKDASAPRYIEARISPVVEKIFPPEDYPLLTLRMEENEQVEPLFMLPIIPNVLLNGIDGIAVGWRSFIPAYNPIAIINNIKRLLRGEKFNSMIPWYRNYGGLVKVSNDGTYFTSQGKFEEKGNDIIITELPLFYWTGTFRAHLDDMIVEKYIKDYSDLSKPETVRFVIKGLTKIKKTDYETLEEWEDAVFEFFGLERRHSLESMVLLRDGKPHKYSTIEEIFNDFIEFRRPYYQKRIEMNQNGLKAELNKIQQAILFIELVLSKRVEIDDIDLINKCLKLEKQLQAEMIEEVIEKYSIRHLRPEGLMKLRKRAEKIGEELAELEKKSVNDLWFEDLNRLEASLKKL